MTGWLWEMDHAHVYRMLRAGRCGHDTSEYRDTSGLRVGYDRSGGFGEMRDGRAGAERGYGYGGRTGEGGSGSGTGNFRIGNGNTAGGRVTGDRGMERSSDRRVYDDGEESRHAHGTGTITRRRFRLYGRYRRYESSGLCVGSRKTAREFSRSRASRRFTRFVWIGGPTGCARVTVQAHRTGRARDRRDRVTGFRFLEYRTAGTGGLRQERRRLRIRCTVTMSVRAGWMVRAGEAQGGQAGLRFDGSESGARGRAGGQARVERGSGDRRDGDEQVRAGTEAGGLETDAVWMVSE